MKKKIHIKKNAETKKTIFFKNNIKLLHGQLVELLANFCWMFLTNAYNFADMPSFMVPQWWSSSTTSLFRVDMDQLSVLLAIVSDMVTHWCVRKDRSFSKTLFSVLLSIGCSFSTILIRYSKVNLVPLEKQRFLYLKLCNS